MGPNPATCLYYNCIHFCIIMWCLYLFTAIIEWLYVVWLYCMLPRFCTGINPARLCTFYSHSSRTLWSNPTGLHSPNTTNHNTNHNTHIQYTYMIATLRQVQLCAIPLYSAEIKPLFLLANIRLDGTNPQYLSVPAGTNPRSIVSYSTGREQPPSTSLYRLGQTPGRSSWYMTGWDKPPVIYSQHPALWYCTVCYLVAMG